MKRPTIKASLVAMMGVVVLSVIILSVVSLRNISVVSGSAADIGNYWVERLLSARQIRGDFADVRLVLARFAMAGKPADIAREDAALKKAQDALDASIARFAAGARTEEAKAQAESILPVLADYRDVAKKYRDMMAVGKFSLAFPYYRAELIPRAEKLNAHLTGVTEEVIEAARARVAEAEGIASTAFIVNLSISGFTILFGAAGMYFAVAGVANPIQSITRAMRRLADGDKSSAIPFTGRADEIGMMAGAVEVFRQNALANERLEREASASRNASEETRHAEQQRIAREAEALRVATSALGDGLQRLANGDLTCRIDHAFAPEYEGLRTDFNATVEQLNRTIGAVITAVENMEGGTREISSGAADLSKRTEQQAASLEETAAALDEITANVTSSSRLSEEARGVARAATESAARSAEVVSHAEQAMQRIEQSSQQISNIIGVIDEIAFQTNLLALNAGVEAARAGEAGKGFAVVAQEVRELAQRSANAAKEIKGLIQNSTTEVEGGVKLVRDTGSALKTIAEHITRINSHMEAIATSSREQSTGLAEVNTAVNNMDQTTQQNAAMVEESTAAAASLAEQAGRLRGLVEAFRLAQGKLQAESLRQTAAVMARAAAPARPVPAASRAPARPVVQGNLARKADEWEEF
jgi:methyl-accepting chemotaxis protein-1 (serine sensor receptor)